LPGVRSGWQIAFNRLKNEAPPRSCEGAQWRRSADPEDWAAGAERHVYGQGLTSGIRAARRVRKKSPVFLGKLQGVFFNDVAGGFLDRTQWACAVSVAAHGYCVGADKDGDRVFTVCRGKDNAPGSIAGTTQYTGGTGKYAGLQGHNTFRGARIGDTMAFSADWQGEWRLP
jgi:hypothetical protein